MEEIIQNQLYIGDAHDVMHTNLQDQGFDAVVSLSMETPQTTHHKKLKDGQNEQDAFDEAVNTVRSLVSDTDTVVFVHCTAGVSRTSAVVATTLAVECDTSFEASLKRLEDARPIVNPHPDLRSHAEKYLQNMPEAL